MMRLFRHRRPLTFNVILCSGKGDPYRLFNLDVFGYSLNNGKGLYGSIPYMIAHR